jgi:hypothetical protein
MFDKFLEPKTWETPNLRNYLLYISGWKNAQNLCYDFFEPMLSKLTYFLALWKSDLENNMRGKVTFQVSTSIKFSNTLQRNLIL